MNPRRRKGKEMMVSDRDRYGAIIDGGRVSCHVGLSEQPVFITQVDGHEYGDSRGAAAKGLEVGQAVWEEVVVIQCEWGS